MNFAAAMMALLLTCTHAHASEFKLLTWNTFMLPKPIKNSRQKERRAVIARELQKLDHDVIVLQEAFMDSFKSSVKAALKRTHPHVYWPKKTRGWPKLFDSGVMVLSKTPLRELDRTYYTSCASFDCYASKAAILLETDFKDAPVQLIVTHMQSGSGVTERNVRRKQLAQIRRMMDRHEVRGTPQIVAGDLNVDAISGDEFQESLEALSISSPPLKGHLVSTKATDTACFMKKNGRGLKRLDHALLKGDKAQLQAMTQEVTPIRGRVNGQVCDLSDHLPVTLTLAFIP